MASQPTDPELCECGRPIRRVVPADGIDLEWTHADDHPLYPGPLCWDGYLDDDGNWQDPPFACPEVNR